MKIILEKRLSDTNGEIIVRAMNDLEGRQIESGINIAEIVTQGCVLAFYELRLIDKSEWFAELHEVHDRLTTVVLDEESLQTALYWGRKIANTIIDFSIVNLPPPQSGEKE